MKRDYLCTRELEFHCVQRAPNVVCDGLHGWGEGGTSPWKQRGPGRARLEREEGGERKKQEFRGESREVVWWQRQMGIAKTKCGQVNIEILHTDECRQLCNIYFLFFSTSIPPSALLFHECLFLHFTFSLVSPCQSFSLTQPPTQTSSALAQSCSKLALTHSHFSFSNTIAPLHTAPGLHFKGEQKTQYGHDFFYH